MDYIVHIVLQLLLIYYRASAQETNDYYDDTRNVFSAVFHKYNENVRPYKDKVMPVYVYVHMSFAKIGNFDRNNMELETVTDLILKWEDSRLYWYSNVIKYITVNSTRIWTPDVGFLNTFTPPETLLSPRFLVVQYNGVVTWHKRLKIKTTCSRNGTESIQCPVSVGSLQFSVNEQFFNEIDCSSDDVLVSTQLNMTEIYSALESRNVSSIPFPAKEISMASCTVTLSDPPKPEPEVAEALVEPEGNGANVISNSLYIITSVFLLVNSFSVSC